MKSPLLNASRLTKLVIISGLLAACTSEREPSVHWQHSELGSYAAAFSPDNRYVLVGDTDLPAKLWDLETNQIKYTWQNVPEQAGTTTAVAFSNDGKVAATCESQIVVLWDIASGKPKTRITFPVTVKAMALSSQGDYLLLALQNRKAIYYDVTANRVVSIMEHDGKPVNSPVNQLINAVAISPNGHYALTGGDDRTVRLWDLQAGKQLRIWLHEAPVSLVAFNTTGAKAVTSAGNAQTRMWDIKSGKQIAVLNRSPFEVDSIWANFPAFKTTTTAIAFSADNQLIATGHPNQQICTWQAKDGAPLDCWYAPRRQALRPGVVIQAMGFSHDSKSVYTESGNGLAQQWQLNGK